MRRHAPAVLLVAAAAALVIGVVQLLMLRIEQGDVYPPYSSLRSDPLGAMALYESLERMPGMTVARDYSSQNRLPAGAATAYLHLAASANDWRAVPREVVQEVERFVAEGGRLVIALYPDAEVPRRVRPDEEEKKKEKPSPEEEAKIVQVKDRWGLTLVTRDLSRNKEGGYDPVRARNVSGLPLPAEIDWHSGIVLDNVSADWRPIYTREGAGPVVAERRFGKGAIVIATDSFFLSNEALHGDRQTALLAWMVGSNHTVYFDEAHLGVTENPGVATLIRRYRLQGLAAALLLVVGLFIWKNSLSLAPRVVRNHHQRIAGKDAASGFVNLLRRNVPPGDLLATCFAEWKAAVQTGTHSAARIERAVAAFQNEATRPSREQDPIRAYAAITDILKKHHP
ncbi:MAG TPA: DUF4350 domain-containing protein [Terriglobia bacterium]|nr:DUF4350 domain-containing protein [Terriglobia bacterium]